MKKKLFIISLTVLATILVGVSLFAEDLGPIFCDQVWGCDGGAGCRKGIEYISTCIMQCKGGGTAYCAVPPR